MRKRSGDPWRWRIPILARASQLTRAVLSDESKNPAAWWHQLGHIHWEATPDLTRPPPGPSDPWDPATGLSWARATYCFRRALVAKPDDVPALRSLAECLGVRRMADARRKVERVLTGKGPVGQSLSLATEHPGTPAILSWSAADQLAVNHLHLGNPESARRAWSEATPPSRALLLTRLAEADLAALDAPAAVARCQRAVTLEPTLGEAWYVLTIATLDSGHAEGALAACREGMKHELTPAQRETLAGVERLLSRSTRANHVRD